MRRLKLLLRMKQKPITANVYDCLMIVGTDEKLLIINEMHWAKQTSISVSQ